MLIRLRRDALLDLRGGNARPFPLEEPSRCYFLPFPFPLPAAPELPDAPELPGRVLATAPPPLVLVVEPALLPLPPALPFPLFPSTAAVIEVVRSPE